jgi:hypothetical protein
MRVIVAGAVAWTNRKAIHRELAKLPPGSTVIHGDCPGVDALAGEIAAALGFLVEPMAKNREDYAKYRRLAWKGLNERMLASDVSLVLVFHPDVDASKGSRHLRDLADAASVEVRVFSE